MTQDSEVREIGSLRDIVEFFKIKGKVIFLLETYFCLLFFSPSRKRTETATTAVPIDVEGRIDESLARIFALLISNCNLSVDANVSTVLSWGIRDSAESTSDERTIQSAHCLKNAFLKTSASFSAGTPPFAVKPKNSVSCSFFRRCKR